MNKAISVFAMVVFACSIALYAQHAPTTADDKGWTSYSSFTEAHDSSLGWSTILNSNAGYDFNRHVSAYVGIPIYFVQPSTSSSTTGGTTTSTTSNSYNSLGDLYLGMTYKAEGSLGYSTTLLGTAPTGSRAHGISTGRATGDWNNHFEHDLSIFTPFIEAGFGNSNTAMNLGHRNGNPHAIGALSYATLGPMAHFQGGTEVSLGKMVTAYISGYDMSPIGNQKIYSRLVKNGQGAAVSTGKGNAKGLLTQNAVTSGTSAIAVDRGFSTGLDFNPRKRIDLGFDFTRSATNSINTVAFSVGYRFGHLAAEGSGR